MRHTEGWTRRAALATLGGAGAAGALAGIGGCDWWDTTPPPPPPDPLEPLLGATRVLHRRYRRTLARHADLAERLAPLMATHDAHIGALLQLIDRPELATPTADSPATATPEPGVPSEPDDAVAALREAEQRGREEAAAACLAAPPERAGLLGSICAARATHVEVLA